MSVTHSVGGRATFFFFEGPAPPLPTKTYTTLVPKFGKQPLFADSGQEKDPFLAEIADFEVQ